MELASSAKRFLRKCDKVLYERIISRIKKLSEDLFPQDVKRVLGRKEKVFRIRVGDYRILYVVFHDRNTVLISDIDKRPRVY
ncbi:MAG: type II toxin-antitoxin system RelE/ParE family toxin [Nanoarchaeota archaeon]